MSGQRVTTNMMAQMRATASHNPLPAISPADIKFTTAVKRLKVTEVVPYDRNPRTTVNEKLTEIKESIKNRGLDQMFAITLRPGDKKHTIAKGGCTRLRSLQELAAEGHTQFAEMDFLLHTYKSESDLLAGHLSENMHRSDMSFWDSAKGVMDMGMVLKEERDAPLSVRELEEALNSQGMAISRAILNDFQFATHDLGSLPDATKVTRNDIRNHLRPLHTLLQGLWVKHPGRFEEAFKVTFNLWASVYQDKAGYDVNRLVDHLTAEAALDLGYPLAQFTAILSAFKTDKTAPLADLIAPFDADTDDTNDSEERFDHGFDGQLDAQQANGYDGLNVASNLTPLTPQSKADLSALAARDVAASAAQQSFMGMAYELPTPQAESELSPEATVWDAVASVATTVGIDHCVVNAPSMPYGFLMEIPTAGTLGDTADDFTVQGWWVLANLSCQLHPDIDTLLNSVDVHGNFVLPDTGPQGFRQVLASEERWVAFTTHSLGGESFLEMSLLIALLTQPDHPLTEPVMALLSCLRRMNQNRIHQTT